jgi:hypothetical protein
MDWIAVIGIHLLLPLLGFILFILLCNWMKRTGIQSPPFLSWFILFGIAGGWLTVFLTALFWRWSGMASLGIAFLMLIAPFLTAGIALGLRNRRSLSPFHRSAYLASIAYSCVAWIGLGGWLWKFSG